MLREIVSSAKRYSGLPQLRDYAIGAYRRRIFERALRDFIADPWASIHSDNDVLSRLIYGWGNLGWSALDEYLVATIEEFSQTDGPVLECGSGLSTIVLGILADISGREIWTLEHNAEWGDKVLGELHDLGIGSVRICVKPLKHYGDFSWYDPPLEEMPRTFSLVICDGPPGGGHGGRSGMLPIMRNFLSDHVAILLDDTIREDEREIARNWSTELGATLENCGTEKPFAAIRKKPPMIVGQPGITVGVPARDSEKTIGQSVDSVLSQSYERLRLLISDNDSSDGTRDECVARLSQDRRVRYFKQIENIGVFRNYNELARKCDTEYFKWQSSSDWCDADFISSCIDALEKNPDAVLACPEVILIDEDGEKEPYDRDFDLQIEDPAERLEYLVNNIQLCNVFNGVMRTSALQRTSLNRQFLGSDVLLLAELALQGKFILIRGPKWYRRMTPATASKLHSTAQRVEFFTGSSRQRDKFVTWKLMFFLMVAILRSNIKLSSKAKCVAYMTRRTFWVRRALWREIFESF